jgi:hypothetical protein
LRDGSCRSHLMDANTGTLMAHGGNGPGGGTGNGGDGSSDGTGNGAPDGAGTCG